MKASSTLTLKQRAFVAQFVASRNATQAAVKAGYSPRTAGVMASRLLRNVQVSDAVAAEIKKRFAKFDINVDNVLQELAKLAFSNAQDYLQVQPDGTAIVDLSLLTRDQAAAITEVETAEFKGVGGAGGVRKGMKVKVKLADKRSALEALCKYALRLGDRLEITGKDGAPLIRPEVTLHIVDSPSS